MEKSYKMQQMTLFSDKMFISHRCIHGLMPNLIKKSWKVSSQASLRIVSVHVPPPKVTFTTPEQRLDTSKRKFNLLQFFWVHTMEYGHPVSIGQLGRLSETFVLYFVNF